MRRRLRRLLATWQGLVSKRLFLRNHVTDIGAMLASLRLQQSVPRVAAAASCNSLSALLSRRDLHPPLVSLAARHTSGFLFAPFALRLLHHRRRRHAADSLACLRPLRNVQPRMAHIASSATGHGGDSGAAIESGSMQHAPALSLAWSAIAGGAAAAAVARGVSPSILLFADATFWLGVVSSISLTEAWVKVGFG